MLARKLRGLVLACLSLLLFRCNAIERVILLLMLEQR